MKGPIGESFLGSFKTLYEKNILKYVELYAPQINDQLPQFRSSMYEYRSMYKSEIVATHIYLFVLSPYGQIL